MKNDHVNALGITVNGLEVVSPNEYLITKLSDLPTPVSTVITLSENDVSYKFAGDVVISPNRIVITGTNVKLHGTNPAIDKITSDHTGDVITADVGINIQDLQLVGFSSTTLLKCTGTGAEFLSSERMTYLGGVTQIDVTDFDTVAVNFGLHQLCTNAIKLDGTFMSYIHLTCLFRDITGVGIDLGTSIFSAIGIHLCTCVNTATTTFISMLTDSGNLIPEGEGTITECKIDTVLGGVGTVGYDPLDLLWYSSGNRNITTSDRILFSGWEFDADDATTPLVLTTTPQIVTNNGLDASSNSDFIPQAIRGTGTLYDTSANIITPIIEGDTYALRVQVTIDSLSGNPNELRMALDIGGGASPTLIIAQDTKAIKGVSEPVIFSFPIFVGATFITNGGQIFMNTDTGTATVGFRSILLSRTSSGAS